MSTNQVILFLLFKQIIVANTEKKHVCIKLSLFPVIAFDRRRKAVQIRLYK